MKSLKSQNGWLASSIVCMYTRRCYRVMNGGGCLNASALFEQNY